MLGVGSHSYPLYLLGFRSWLPQVLSVNHQKSPHQGPSIYQGRGPLIYTLNMTVGIAKYKDTPSGSLTILNQLHHESPAHNTNRSRPSHLESASRTMFRLAHQRICEHLMQPVSILKMKLELVQANCVSCIPPPGFNQQVHNTAEERRDMKSTSNEGLAVSTFNVNAMEMKPSRNTATRARRFPCAG